MSSSFWSFNVLWTLLQYVEASLGVTQAKQAMNIIMSFEGAGSTQKQVSRTFSGIKYTPTQLGVAGSLLPKTLRDAPHNREVNRKKILIALNTNNVDRSLIAKRMLTSMATIRLYLPGVAWNFCCGI